ncbi:MAG: hypothetical protein GVY19_08450 [Bacteroidetes bacterium]|jgi:linoleoyl-CoA desaturase|nr:hypothetical protein [Bacteroidota bacterium]
MALVYLTPFGLIVTGTVSTAISIMICYFIMALGMAGLGMATMHDANHGAFSKNKRVNQFFGKSLYLLDGFPPNLIAHTYSVSINIT